MCGLNKPHEVEEVLILRNSQNTRAIVLKFHTWSVLFIMYLRGRKCKFISTYNTSHTFDTWQIFLVEPSRFWKSEYFKFSKLKSLKTCIRILKPTRLNSPESQYEDCIWERQLSSSTSQVFKRQSETRKLSTCDPVAFFLRSIFPLGRPHIQMRKFHFWPVVKSSLGVHCYASGYEANTPLLHYRGSSGEISADLIKNF